MSEIVHDPHIVKARRDHQCGGCLGKIACGEQYQAATYSDGGDLYTWRLCGWCLAQLKDPDVRNAVEDWDGTMGEGAMREVEPPLEGLPAICKQEQPHA